MRPNIQTVCFVCVFVSQVIFFSFFFLEKDKCVSRNLLFVLSSDFFNPLAAQRMTLCIIKVAHMHAQAHAFIYMIFFSRLPIFMYVFGSFFVVSLALSLFLSIYLYVLSVFLMCRSFSGAILCVEFLSKHIQCIPFNEKYASGQKHRTRKKTYTHLQIPGREQRKKNST